MPENRRPSQNTVDQQSSTYHKPNSRKNSAMQRGIARYLDGKIRIDKS